MAKQESGLDWGAIDERYQAAATDEEIVAARASARVLKQGGTVPEARAAQDAALKQLEADRAAHEAGQSDG